MKKLLFFAAATAVALSSCSKDEVTASAADAQKAISFSTYSAAATKALADTEDVKDGFTVSAVYDNGILMDKLSVTYDSDDEVYEYTGSYYWPSGVTSIDFLAYTGFVEAAAGTTLSTSDGASFQSYTAAGETDPVIAYAPGEEDEAVALTFKHALAKITTTVSADANADEALTLHIKEITYSGYDDEAVCSVDASNGITWATEGTDGTYKVYEHNTGGDLENVADYIEAFTLIPSANVTLTISGYWTIGDAGEEVTVEDFYTTAKTATIDASTVGTHYTVAITLTPQVKAISFTVESVEGWESDTTTNVVNPDTVD